MKVIVKKYNLDLKQANNIITAGHLFTSLYLSSDRTNQNYLKTKNLKFQEIRDNRLPDTLPRKFLVEFNILDLFYN